jgi:uncharacterized protein with HEPN domain
MTSARLVTDYLRDILEYAEKAQRFAQAVDWEKFQRNEEKVLAVIRTLEVMGEAARHIPNELRTQYPRVPWRGLTGMRDKVIHDYAGVDLEVVWNTVHKDLPILQVEVTQMLADLEAGESSSV